MKKELEKKVADVYTLLGMSAPENAKKTDEIAFIKEVVSGLCMFARSTNSLDDYEWATEKFLQFEAVLIVRFNTCSGKTFPYSETELTEE